MDAGLKLEASKDASARDRGDDFAVTAEVIFSNRDDLSLPVVKVGIALVHAKQVGGE